MIYRDGKKADSPEELEDDKESGNNSTLIPKSLLPEGVKPGDEIRLKVLHSFDGELEVEYKSKEKKDAGDNESPEPVSEDMDKANIELEEMAT